MIGILKGTIFSKKPNHVIIMIRGVGYRVFTTPALLEKLPVGKEKILHIYTHVRKDILDLFGFSTEEELKLFELITAISGIGPKRALLIVDKGVGDVEKAVISGDVSFFTTIPRLGKKNAQKVIIELKSKLGDTGELDLTGDDGQTQEVVNALKSLGFSKKEVIRILPKIPKTSIRVEEQIKDALKLLGDKNL